VTSKQTVTSLAVLTVKWNHGQDVIDSFLPLIADCIRKDGKHPVSLVELQKAVEQEGGIKIPSGALQAILRRCAHEGLVRREHDVYYPQREKLDQLDYGPLRAEALRQHRALLDRLLAFAKKRYEIVWSEQEADAALLGWMQDASLPVLVAATDGDPLPFITRQSRKTKHVLNAFAWQLAERDREGFDCLETVVKGYVLSGVLFYPDLGRFQTHFEQLDVYCDTPFILRALGYSDEGQHVQCLDLVELLRELGANLKCFHHTREEVVGVLEWAAARLRPGAVNSDPAVDYAPAKTFRLTDIEEMILDIDDVLGTLDIEVVDTPAWTEQPDEVALEDEIKKQIDYARDRAREKDVKSLAAVARLRGLRRMEKFETARAIFVTSNISLARASSAFFRETEGRGSIPVCMPVELMTRLAWVKKPMAAPDLPKHMVMAASYAALNPPVPLWREYLAAIKERHERGELSDEVIGEAADGAEAVERARADRPDVVLMDIRMPGLDGLEATRRITADPSLESVRVVMLTTFGLDEYVFEALHAGASGFLLKEVEPDELREAVRVVARGDALLSPSVTRRLIQEFVAQPGRHRPPPARLEQLTEREREVLGLVALGLSNQEIAERLVISPATAKTHVSRTMLKLHAHDRAQLVVIAYESGLVRVPQ
jgi:DNA-binding NarL/FixJ family response regulator